uniref:Uncharacterized protein n=1 Tax=Anguilla anguilla TaxID=7936 RepID=A0A0E9W2P3_ANGAN
MFSLSVIGQPLNTSPYTHTHTILSRELSPSPSTLC